MGLKIDEKYIESMASDYATFYKAKSSVQKKEVLSLDYHDTTVYGTVEGAFEPFYPKIEFGERLAIIGTTCNCMDGSNGRKCKHILAVLLSIQFDISQEDISDSPLQNVAKLVCFDLADPHRFNKNYSYYPFTQFELPPVETTPPETLQLEISLSFSNNDNRGVISPVCGLTFKLGKDKLYSIKGLKSFFEAVEKKQTVTLSKTFDFLPTVHTFTKEDQAILDFIQNLVTVYGEYHLSAIRHSSAPKLVDGKTLKLNADALIKKLFDLLVNKPFSLNLTAYLPEQEVISVLGYDETTQVNLGFHVEQDGVSADPLYRLHFSTKQLPIPLTSDYEYVFYNGKLLHLAPQASHVLDNTLSKLLMYRGDIGIKPHQLEHFMNKVYPGLSTIGTITLDERLQKLVVDDPLIPKIYLDLYETGIRAKVFFHYGSCAFNPLGTHLVSEQILVREVALEQWVTKQFDTFRIFEDGWVLSDTDLLFAFLDTTLPKLQDKAEMYYSEEFKTLKKSSPKVTSKLSLPEGSMFEFSFRVDGIDRSDIHHILKAIHLKKKFYRLKDGAFLSLENTDLLPLAQITDSLHLSSADLSKEVISLPLSKALYLESLLADAPFGTIARSKDYKAFLSDLREPAEESFQLPAVMAPILRDYQATGYKWLKALSSYHLGGILADDMGLGKTLQALTFIASEYEKNQIPSLIVAPTSLLYNWENEVAKFTPHLKILVVSGMKEIRSQLLEDIHSYAMIITSYPLLRRDIEQYTQFTYAYCFLDEAQHIKNPLSKTAEAVKLVKAGGYFALTGTPIENNLAELWSIFDFVLPGYFPKLSNFLGKYEKPIANKDTILLGRLKQQIQPFIMRRMKRDVLKELPPKIETVAIAQLEDAQKTLYLAYLEEVKERLHNDLATEGYSKSQIKILAYLTRLRQICCHPGMFIEDYTGGSGKLALLTELLSDALEAGHKVLIFSQFTSMLRLIRNTLDNDNISYDYLDGSVPALARKKMVDDFNEGDTQVFLISLKAGGTGLNLTSADVVIHFDPWWNPAVEDQATDRAYRIGQKNKVQVFKILTHGTIEEKIYALQEKKRALVSSIIEPGETFVSKMTETEILGLFDLANTD